MKASDNYNTAVKRKACANGSILFSRALIFRVEFLCETLETADFQNNWNIREQVEKMKTQDSSNMKLIWLWVACLSSFTDDPCNLVASQQCYLSANRAIFSLYRIFFLVNENATLDHQDR